MQRIEDVVNGVLDALRERGGKESSIQGITWSTYRPIINWHYEHGTEFYSDRLLVSLCERQKARYEGGEISRKFYRSFVTASFRIRSYATTGKVDFSIVKDTRKYIPNEFYLGLTEAILQSTDLNDGYKNSLSTQIRHFFCFIQGYKADTTLISSKEFVDFIYEAAKTNGNNMDTVIRALRIVATYLIDHQLAEIQTDFNVFRPQAPPVHLISPYSQNEINLVLAVINSSHSKTPLRDRAIILLAFNTGLRCVDIRNLKLMDIDWKKQELRIVQKKTGKPITSPLDGKTLNAIADYILKERPKCSDNYVFVRAYPT